MGVGEHYLEMVFCPWWHTLSLEAQESYLTEWQAPRDWRQLLKPHTRGASG